MSICEKVYLNGTILPLEQAKISPLDRAFLFGHAGYEVVTVYGGKFIDLKSHLSRLAKTLEGIAIPNPHTESEWEAIYQTLLNETGIVEGLIYLEVTAGAYDGREFAGPDQFIPTVFLYAGFVQ